MDIHVLNIRYNTVKIVVHNFCYYILYTVHRFLKEEPDSIEDALKRCKRLTGTLFTLKRWEYSLILPCIKKNIALYPDIRSLTNDLPYILIDHTTALYPEKKLPSNPEIRTLSLTYSYLCQDNYCPVALYQKMEIFGPLTFKTREIQPYILRRTLPCIQTDNFRHTQVSNSQTVALKTRA